MEREAGAGYCFVTQIQTRRLGPTRCIGRVLRGCSRIMNVFDTYLSNIPELN
jgi:hypothetical protein